MFYYDSLLCVRVCVCLSCSTWADTTKCAAENCQKERDTSYSLRWNRAKAYLARHCCGPVTRREVCLLFFFFKELWIWVRYVSKSISCKASFFFNLYFVCDFITYLRCADCSDTPMILLFSLIRKFNITKPLQPRGKGISNFQWIGVRYTCKTWFRFFVFAILSISCSSDGSNNTFHKTTRSVLLTFFSPN